jgi:hypothetical protein
MHTARFMGSVHEWFGGCPAPLAGVHWILKVRISIAPHAFGKQSDSNKWAWRLFYNC